MSVKLHKEIKMKAQWIAVLAVMIGISGAAVVVRADDSMSGMSGMGKAK